MRYKKDNFFKHSLCLQRKNSYPIKSAEIKKKYIRRFDVERIMICLLHKKHRDFVVFIQKNYGLVQYIENTTVLYSAFETTHLYTTLKNMMRKLRSKHHDLHSTQKIP
jgi:hypothetical protein